MTTLREEFEALMPEPWQCFQLNTGWNTWENVIPGACGEPGVVAAYTADQVREAMKAVAERCAVLVESCPPPLKLEGGRIEIGERARNAFAAAIRAQAGGDHE